jgi:hypothetical protein
MTTEDGRGMKKILRIPKRIGPAIAMDIPESGETVSLPETDS